MLAAMYHEAKEMSSSTTQAVEQLRALLCRVRDAGALDDNQGAEDWSFSDKVIDEAMSVLADTLKIVGGEIKIDFTSSKREAGTVNRNDPFYHTIHTALMDISTWSKAGGKLELHHIDNYARKIMKAANQEQRQRLELVVGEMRTR